MACRDCFNAKILVKINSDNPLKTKLTNYIPSRKVKCAKDFWLDANGNSKQFIYLSVINDGDRIQEHFRVCPFKDIEEEYYPEQKVKNKVELVGVL